MTPTLRPYQEQGRDWLRGGPTGTIPRMLADDPGLGKSGQYLCNLLTHPGARPGVRALILAPAIGRVSWALEVPKWMPNTKVVIVGNEPPPWTAQSCIYICSYDTATVNKKIRTWLLDHHWNFLGLDEAHYLKSPSAKRTQLVYGKNCDGGPDSLVARVKMRVVSLLTGTPTPNHSGEIWTHLRALRPGLLQKAGVLSRIAFEDKFCIVKNTIYGRQIVGSRNQAELRELCKDFILRRRKSDVLKELPAVQVVDTPLELSDTELQNIAAVMREAGMVPKALEVQTEEVLLATLREHGTNLSAMRRAFGMVKAPAAARWVRERLDAGVPKIIVFAHHKDVLDTLARGLADMKQVRVDGATSQAERTERVASFQNDPSVRVFLGNIQAAGTAITLTAASEVAMVEASWVPSDNDQAISRAHRMGQKDGVLATFLYMPGTLDERIMRVFRKKAEQTASIYDE